MSPIFYLGVFTIISLPLTEGRIWFEGQIHPGTNKTVGSSLASADAGLLVERLEAGERRQVAALVSRGIGRIALQLEAALASVGVNSLFSPLGVTLALALVLLGANGSTHEEIITALGLPPQVSDNAVRLLEEEFSRLFNILGERPTEGGPLFALASGVFVQKNFSIQAEYVALARSLYSSDVVALDFIHDGRHSQDAINNWVMNRTDGHISNLLSYPLGFDTRVVIVSAIYFNGAWEIPFNPQFTKKQEFHVTPTTSTTVDMMVGAGDVLFHENAERKVLGLSYKGGTTVMYFILPTGELDSYVASLNSSRLHEVIDSAVPTKNVIYAVPKMKLMKTVNLREALENMGIVSLFGPDADLRKLADGLWASSVIHKVELEVDEVGTSASAATAVDLVRSGGGLVRLDKPFALFLYHRPSTIVTFWATVHDPNQNI